MTVRRRAFPLPEETLSSRERLVLLALLGAVGLLVLNGLVVYLLGSVG